MNTLIVDDEHLTAKMLKRLFDRYGRCDATVSGDEALAFFKKAWQSEAPYDLIVMDIMMPGVSGIEVYEAIRDYEIENGVKDGCETKIILMTGMGVSLDMFKIYTTSCMAYLYKPIDMKELVSVLNQLKLPLSSDVSLQSLK
ncbi:MAG: response regulator [Nitrospirae bacterium]|nr:response regulator [Nitrospirota bacterium]